MNKNKILANKEKARKSLEQLILDNGGNLEMLHVSRRNKKTCTK